MSPAKRERREALRAETRRAVEALEARGVCWSDWARERGFAPHAVKDVVRDRNPATRGELFEVAARIRAEAGISPGPSGPDRESELEAQITILGMALSACEQALASCLLDAQCRMQRMTPGDYEFASITLHAAMTLSALKRARAALWGDSQEGPA